MEGFLKNGESLDVGFEHSTDADSQLSTEAGQEDIRSFQGMDEDSRNPVPATSASSCSSTTEARKKPDQDNMNTVPSTPTTASPSAPTETKKFRTELPRGAGEEDRSVKLSTVSSPSSIPKKKARFSTHGSVMVHKTPAPSTTPSLSEQPQSLLLVQQEETGEDPVANTPSSSAPKKTHNSPTNGDQEPIVGLEIADVNVAGIAEHFQAGAPEDQVFCSVPGRLGILNNSTKYPVTVAEIRRRTSAPENLNLAAISGFLRRGKAKDGLTVLSDELEKVGMMVPKGKLNGSDSQASRPWWRKRPGTWPTTLVKSAL